jgi:hypothetical protein
VGGREELMDEVSMGRVQFHEVEPGGGGPAGTIHEELHDAGDRGRAQLL